MRGGGRMGGSLGGSRSSGGSLGGSLGGGRSGQGLARPGRAPTRVTAPRAVQPRRSNAGSFGMGMATGMMLGGGRRRRSMWGWGGGFGRRRHVGGRGGGGCGCFTMILAVFVLIIAFSVMMQFTGGLTTSVDVPRSTITRTALPRNAASTPAPRFVDHLGWINNSSRLTRGMDDFHRETGVMPFVYITDNLDGNRRPNMTDMENYAQRLFTRGLSEWNLNEANLVILVFEYDGGYGHRIVVGNQADTVMDSEAIDILSACIRYYWYADMDACEMFNRAFNRASDRIMSVHRSPWIPVMVVVGVLLILFLLYTWWKAKQDRKREEAAETERILNQDLTEFGSSKTDEASNLAQLYEDDNKN